MQYEIILLFFIFLFGIVTGSFMNVCIVRLPKKENIAIPGSHCMSCGQRLRWKDIVPVISWLKLGGKCRYCKAKISVQYPLIEMINGIGYVLVFLIKGYSIDSIILCLFMSCLIVLSVIDWRSYEIPFGINFLIFWLGIIRVVIFCIDNSSAFKLIVTSHVSGFLCVSLFLIFVNMLTGGKSIGGGDIKLMAAAGLLLGWKEIALGFFLGCVTGSIIHLTLMKVMNKSRVLAFGPYLSMGMIIAMLWGDRLIDWYLTMYK